MKRMPLPEWNPSTDDFDHRNYLKQLRDCERSMLPPDIVFPQTGQVWETVLEGEVFFRAWFAKRPATDGKARLPLGKRIRVIAVDDPKPLWVHFEPVRYKEMEKIIVPRDLWCAPDYDHYELYAGVARIACWFNNGYEIAYFVELFRLVDETAQPSSGPNHR